MSRVTPRRTALVASSCLAALALLNAGPAYANSTATASPSNATSPTTAVTTISASVSVTPSASATPTSPPPSSTTPARPTLHVAAVTTPVGSPLARAAQYVVASLADGDHVVGPFGPDLGQTADVALGLTAAGGQAATLADVVAYLRANGAAYVHGDPSFGEKADANYAGPTGKLALVAQATGNDPTAFAGSDLIRELRALMSANGRFVDDSEFGDFSNPLGQSFDILALERATTAGAPAVAVDFLVAAQCADGGFPEAFGAKTCTSSPDATGLALQALIAADADCAAAKAQGWLLAARAANGSFGSNAVDPTKPAVANINSTAYAAMGLNAARTSTASTVSYLTSVQNADGGLPTVPSTSPASNLFATAQALTALDTSSFLALGPRPIAASAPICTTATSAPTPSATPTSSPTGTPTAGPSTSVPTTSAATTSATASDTSSSTTSSTSVGTSSSPNTIAFGAPTDTDDPVISQSGGALPQTGADLLTPVAVGFGLLFVGLTLLLASRRRAGRHA